jgi:hypothetical protein
VEHDISYSADVQVGVGLLLGGSWAASSRSGDLNTPDPSTAFPAPTQQMIDSGLVNSDSSGQTSNSGNDNPIDVPEDGLLDLDHSATGDAWLADAGGWEPMPQPLGHGHQYGSSGGASANITNSNSGGLSFSAKVRGNDQLTALSGSIRSGFANKYGDSSHDNEILVFSAGDSDGSSAWSGTLMVGNNVQSQDARIRNDNQAWVGVPADNRRTIANSGKYCHASSQAALWSNCRGPAKQFPLTTAS